MSTLFRTPDYIQLEPLKEVAKIVGMCIHNGNLILATTEGAYILDPNTNKWSQIFPEIEKNDNTD